MAHVIIGTAGHVDHGKTELIRALTGEETDRLREEKDRGISIELGFAPFDLPDGRRAGVVDVPGHEKFVHHMLAGVPGFDLVLLVVAADEGVMPQTQEHLDILHLLGVRQGILVLTKVDLVPDRDLLDLAVEEVREEVKGTFLEEAPLYRVSARTGQGLEPLLNAIAEITRNLPGRQAKGAFRLPIDRSFSLSGLGTVITGTLLSGQLEVGQGAEIVPGRLACRLRRLQVHGSDVKRAQAGQRVAVNLSGVSVSQARRGRVLAATGAVPETRALDAKLHLLPRAPRNLNHRARIRFHSGTAEVMGRVSLLDCDELKPGQEAWVQLRLEQPVAVQRGDRYVIRFYSPVFTLGGGWVVEPRAPRRRRHHLPTLEELELKSRGDPAELVLQALREAGASGLTVSGLAGQLGLSGAEGQHLLQSLVEQEQAVRLGLDEELYMAASALEEARQRLAADLEQFHRRYPLRHGSQKETARTRLFPELSPRSFQGLIQHLEKQGSVRTEREYLRLSSHQVEFDPRQAELARRLEEAFVQSLFSPPEPQTLLREYSDPDKAEILQALLEQGLLVRVSENLVFHRRGVEEAERILRALAETRGGITVSDFRQALQTSRKYALPLLEHFDALRITRRVGDQRVLVRPPPAQG